MSDVPRQTRQQQPARHRALRRQQVERHVLLERADEDVDLAPVRPAQVSEQALAAPRVAAQAVAVARDKFEQGLARRVVHTRPVSPPPPSQQ